MAPEQNPQPIKLNWKTNNPIWVDQWLLSQEKLIEARNLVQEQLKTGHIIPSNQPLEYLYIYYLKEIR